MTWRLYKFLFEDSPETIETGETHRLQCFCVKMTVINPPLETCRCGPLLQVSLVGTRTEECGGYFERIVSLLGESKFLSASFPWGPKSILDLKNPAESDDGPILWTRPGEQLIPTRLSRFFLIFLL